MLVPEMCSFNLHDGYAEAWVRGNRSALLSPEDYRKLTVCETLEDLRSALEDTDLAGFMVDEPLPISVAAISQRLRERLTDEFRVIQSLADIPLRQFLDFIVAERMIDNVVSLIQGAINGKSQEELLAKADPLGWVPEMRALLAIDSTNGYEDLFRTVLVETPVGGYFENYLENKKDDANKNELNDLDLEIMRASLKKSWLEDFFQFCCTHFQKKSQTSKEVMCDILQRQADYLCLSVALNSLNTPMGGQTKLSDRNALFPHFGYLYPASTEALRKATNEQGIRAAIETNPEYLDVFEQCRGYYARGEEGVEISEAQLSLEDALYRSELTMYETAFEQQMHYGVFYAWVKLKEQEIRNILWVADMILMHRRDTCMDRVLPIFAPRV